jgi:excisionase family DNA binding protein
MLPKTGGGTMGWITTTEAAALKNVGVRTIQDWISKYGDSLKTKRFGRDWMIDEDSLRAFTPPRRKGRPTKEEG